MWFRRVARLMKGPVKQWWGLKHGSPSGPRGEGLDNNYGNLLVPDDWLIKRIVVIGWILSSVLVIATLSPPLSCLRSDNVITNTLIVCVTYLLTRCAGVARSVDGWLGSDADHAGDGRRERARCRRRSAVLNEHVDGYAQVCTGHEFAADRTVRHSRHSLVRVHIVSVFVVHVLRLRKSRRSQWRTSHLTYACCAAVMMF